MGTLNYKSEGGQGGKRGHSNMDHWVTTEEIKSATRSSRRREGKAIIRAAAAEHATAPARTKPSSPR